MSTNKSKKARPLQSLGTFFLGVAAFMAFRWILFEPYVIPSGSMIPSLLIYDHIFVSKSAYGIRYPFSQKWLTGPKLPERGDVVIFQSVEEDIVMIKRVVGLPGDSVQVSESGEVSINGQKVNHKKQSPEEVEAQFPLRIDCKDCDDFYLESFEGREHLIQLSRTALHSAPGKYDVPAGHLFVMGDNRDQSRDSRYWGVLPLENLLGQARWIWLSCDRAASKAPVLCHPGYIRWQRVFSAIQ